MRRINIGSLDVDAAWETDARAALAEARTRAAGKARSDYIKSQSDIWSRLKPKLEALSDRKCWYCEAREIRSDRAVDHYRPKNNVRDSDPPHQGYWWLAFDPLNYRLCCTYCNSRRKDRETGAVGGKGDYFPLEDEARRLLPESRDFHNEGALLIDPCKPGDVALLWFTDDGRVTPKHDKNLNPFAFKRADISIEQYNLNERDIKDKRLGLYDDIKKLIERGDFHYVDYLNGDPNAGFAIDGIIEDLAKYVKKDAEFSAFAIATIKGFRGGPKREWMDGIELV